MASEVGSGGASEPGKAAQSAAAWRTILAAWLGPPPTGFRLVSAPEARRRTALLVARLVSSYELVVMADALHNKCGPKELRRLGIGLDDRERAADATWSLLLANLDKRYEPTRASGWLDVIRLLTPGEGAGLPKLHRLPIDRLARVGANIVSELYTPIVEARRGRVGRQG